MIEDVEAYTLIHETTRFLLARGVVARLIGQTTADDLAADCWVELKRRGTFDRYNPVFGLTKAQYLNFWTLHALLDLQRKTPEGRELERERNKKRERKDYFKNREQTRSKRDRSEYKRDYMKIYMRKLRAKKEGGK